MNASHRNDRLLAAFGGVVITLGLLAQPTPVGAVSTPEPTLSAWGTAQIDGVKGKGEWDGAARIDFQATLPAVDGGATVPAAIYVMNDATNLYLATSLAAIPGCTYNPIFEFDNNGDGNLDKLGNDWLAVHAFSWASGSVELLDMFMYPLHNVGLDTFSGSGYPAAGTIDGTAGASHPRGTTTWVELSHPLDSADDAHDFSLAPGDTVGFLFDAHITGTGCGNCTEPGCQGSTRVPALGLARILVHPDVEAPIITAAPRVAGAVPSTLGHGSTLITWSGTDGRSGTGIVRYDLQQQRDGGSWTNVVSSAATSVTRSLLLGHSYGYRVRALDRAGNVSAWSIGRTVVPSLVEGSSWRVHYPIGTWHTQSTANASGGSTRWSTSTRARVIFDFTGRAVAWVASTGPNRGVVNVYLDGSLRATVDLRAVATRWKQVVFSTSWAGRSAHTLQLRSTRPGQRVDVDAFVVYR